MKKDTGIRIILNGYFRSGTTFLWRYLNNSLKNDFICFYEPLHPELAKLVSLSLKGERFNFLHKDFLWEEYTQLNERILNKLFINHPNITNDGISNEFVLKLYLDIFDNLNKKVLLQPNRLHFFFDFLSQNYNCKIIHIVRHPLDVFSSMQKMYDDNPHRGIKRLIIKILKPYGALYLTNFEIEKNYLWIKRHYGINSNNFSIRFFNPFDIFGKFVVVWTISNYYAMKSLERNKGHLIVYEKLIQDTTSTLKDLCNYLEIPYNSDLSIKENNSFKFEKNEIQRLLKKVKSYGIEKEFNYILQKINTGYNIKYLK